LPQCLWGFIIDTLNKSQTSKPKHLNSIHSCIQHSKMVKKTKCIHKLTLPLYARGEKWISSKKVTGEMIYICTKCGAILDRGFIERDANQKEEKLEIQNEANRRSMNKNG